jgi:hypothetical protein
MGGDTDDFPASESLVGKIYCKHLKRRARVMISLGTYRPGRTLNVERTSCQIDGPQPLLIPTFTTKTEVLLAVCGVRPVEWVPCVWRLQ